MAFISRPFRYHVWHRSVFNRRGLSAFASRTISVPKTVSRGVESKTVYSLKKDMDELRRRGVAKGIVDAGVSSIGTSHNGKEIWALKVGLGSSHKVLFTGCHHAREWISVEVPYYVAEYLIETYNPTPTTEKEKRIKHLLHNRQIWFVPMVNPDGHDYTTRRNRNWRPNRRAHRVPGATIPRHAINGGPKTFPTATYTGVDINRNYDTSDWSKETFYPPPNEEFASTSRDPRDGGENSTWCGIAGSGEAESSAIDSLINANNFRSSISYHSYSQLLLYPDAAGGDAFVRWVGKGLIDLINLNGNPYTYESGGGLYPTTGGMMDFCYEKVPGRPTYTPELRPLFADRLKWGFSKLPEAQIGPCIHENLASALALINCAGHDGPASGKKCNFTSGNPAGKCQFVRNCWEVFQGWTP